MQFPLSNFSHSLKNSDNKVRSSLTLPHSHSASSSAVQFLPSLLSITALASMEESFRTGAKGIHHMEIFPLQYLSQSPPNWTIEGPLCRGNRKTAFWPDLVYTNLTKSTTDHVEKYHLENDCFPGLSIGFLPTFCSGSCEGYQGKLPPASTLDQALCPAAWD